MSVLERGMDPIAMMTSRDRVIRTLRHDPVDRAPRDLWIAPGFETVHGDEVQEILYRYPNDIMRPELRLPRGHRARGNPHEVGQFTDAWGCVWEVGQRGTMGQLKHAPLADLRQVASYRPPTELLEKAPYAAVNRTCAATSRFVLAWSDVRPLERLQWLHGPEATRVDLDSGTPALRDLLAMLHEWFCRELLLWAGTAVDGVVFQDDWGARPEYTPSRQVFRELFLPLYREYCDILRAADKFVFFCVRGQIQDLLDDLVETGIDAIHADLSQMDFEWLAERFRNRVTFWNGIDQPRLLAVGRPEEVRAGVRRVRAALDFGRGGLIAQCLWNWNVPFQNIAALFEQWLAPLPAHASAK